MAKTNILSKNPERGSLRIRGNPGAAERKTELSFNNIKVSRMKESHTYPNTTNSHPIQTHSLKFHTFSKNLLFQVQLRNSKQCSRTLIVQTMNHHKIICSNWPTENGATYKSKGLYSVFKINSPKRQVINTQ